MSHRLTFLFCLLISLPALGQKKVQIVHADEGYYISREDGIRKNRLVGNVAFEHEGAYMYCDSAWYFSATNTLEAFSNVRLTQGDTLQLWSRYLKYNGNTRVAQAVDSVRLEDGKMILKTPELLFDRNAQTAYYTRGGRIWNGENRLVSRIGTYHSAAKTFYYQKDVVLTNPRYVIESDTLKYVTPTRTAYFIGPSTITSDSSFIYCENGLYDTRTDIAQFEKNARIINQAQLLTGDSIYYEKKTGYGEVFGHVYLLDTADQYLIRGGFAEYREKPEYAFVTDDPLYTVLVDGDSLHIHGDTLRMNTLEDSTRMLRVFRGVRIFKTDMQGLCDSLVYTTLDSSFRLFYDPILWNKASQLTGDFMILEVRKGVMDSLKVYGNGFIISADKLDSLKYNQIKGKNIYGKFSENELRKVLVKGNGQTGYYTSEEGATEHMGYYRADCSNILIRLLNSEVDKIAFLVEPDAHLYPMKSIPDGEEKLKGFTWRLNEKPRSKADLFQ